MTISWVKGGGSAVIQRPGPEVYSRTPCNDATHTVGGIIIIILNIK